ncbi:MAG TPA: hypothetical protein DCS87_15755 [Rheinheimera sp.]|jgi:hypothetical protein|nr:hypothetical protein [Rheinheimera sp.]
MTQDIGNVAVAQGFEMLSTALANKQQKMEGQMAMQLLQGAAQPAAPSPVGNLGNNIDIKV